MEIALKNNFNQQGFDTREARDARWRELRYVEGKFGMYLKQPNHVYRDTTSVLDENGKGKMVYRVRWPERYEDDLHSRR